MGPRTRAGLALAAAGLIGCAGAREREADQAYTPGLARVEHVDVVVSPVLATHARIIATGTLPDACTHIDRLYRDRLGQRIEITITTRRRSYQICTPALQPFEQSYLLPLTNLPTGVYTITVNGVSEILNVVSDAEDRWIPTLP